MPQSRKHAVKDQLIASQEERITVQERLIENLNKTVSVQKDLFRKMLLRMLVAVETGVYEKETPQ